MIVFQKGLMTQPKVILLKSTESIRLRTETHKINQ